MEFLRVVFLLFALVAVAMEPKAMLQLYEKLFQTIFQKKEVQVFLTDPQLIPIFAKSRYLHTVSSCQKADVVLGTVKVCPNQWHFVTSYRAFKEDGKIVGALYWRKGRPQLRLKKEALLMLLGKVPKELQRYVY